MATIVSGQNAEYIAFTQPATSPTASPKPTTLPTGRIAVILVNGTGSKIQQATTTVTYNTVETLDELVEASCGTVVKITQTNGVPIGVSVRNISKMSPTSGTNTGCTITVAGYTAGVKTNTSYSDVVALLESCYSGGGGGGTNIYNSDGTITDETRTVDCDGNSLNILNAAGIAAQGNAVQIASTAPVLYPFGLYDLQINRNTGGPILNASSGTGSAGYLQAVVTGAVASGDSTQIIKNTGAANTGSKLTFRRVNSSGVPRWFGIRASDGITGDYTWVLPETSPSAGQVLSVASFSPSTGDIQLGYSSGGGGGGSGTVTSVGLTMPSAFSVSSSPITTSGTLEVLANGSASEYIRGDGTLATLPSNTNWSNSSLTADGSYTQSGNGEDLTVTRYGQLNIDASAVVLNATGSNSFVGVLSNQAYMEGQDYAQVTAGGRSVQLRTNSDHPVEVIPVATGGAGNSQWFSIGAYNSTNADFVYNSFMTDSTQNANLHYVLPKTQGAANSMLTNDGTGKLSWGAGGGGSVDSTNIVANGVSLGDLSSQILNRLPLEGVTTNTLRHNGTNWVTSTNLLNNGTQVGLGATPNASYRLLVKGTASATTTFALRVENLAGAENFSVRDDGRLKMSNVIDAYQNSSTQAGYVLSHTTSNSSFSVVPNGTGAFMLEIPDGTSTGGNARGSNAIDLQTVRSANTQVASGTNSAILGGTSNTSSGTSSIAGGQVNVASGNQSIALGGQSTTASGVQSVVIGGASNTASALQATVVGGTNNNVSGQNSSALGGSFNVVAGQYSTGIGSTNTVPKNYSNAIGYQHNMTNGTGSYITMLGAAHTITSGASDVSASTALGTSNQIGSYAQMVQGTGAIGRAYGEFARSTGSTGPIVTKKYAGTSEYTMGGHGVGKGQFELYLDQGATTPSIRLDIPSNSAGTFQVTCTAVATVADGTLNLGDTGHAIFLIGAKNVSGTSTATSITTDFNQSTGNMPGLAWSLNVDDTTDTFRVLVTPPGAAGVTSQINAECKIEAVWQHF